VAPKDGIHRTPPLLQIKVGFRLCPDLIYVMQRESSPEDGIIHITQMSRKPRKIMDGK